MVVGVGRWWYVVSDGWLTDSLECWNWQGCGIVPMAGEKEPTTERIDAVIRRARRGETERAFVRPPPAGDSAWAWASALWARRGAWGPSSSKNAWEQHGWCWPRGMSEHSGSHEALSSLGLSAGRGGV